MDLFAYNPAIGAVEETIDFAGDYDVYQVELTGGFDYVASALGASNLGGDLQDPYIQIYDSQSGQLLFEADDSPLFGYDPLLEFQAPASGIYDVVVAGYGSSSGSYTFDLDQAGVPSSTIGTPPEEWQTVVPFRGV